ncbi:Zn-ribbon domain-containing OB-fold protein [Streptomyces sp. NPDC002004]
MSHTQTPVVDGWFRGDGDAFRLLGTRCAQCGSVFFPRAETFCRNPSCHGEDLVEVPLSRHGRIWSYTDGRYRPPEPYVSDRELDWQPRALIAAELLAERMVVLGQAPPGVTVDDLAVGMEVVAVPGVLHEDAETTWTTWYWRPTGVTA